MKLFIKETCVGDKGAIHDAGTTVEISDERTIYNLVVAGRAVDASTDEGKKLVDAAAKAAAAKAAAAKDKK